MDIKDVIKFANNKYGRLVNPGKSAFVDIFLEGLEENIVPGVQKNLRDILKKIILQEGKISDLKQLSDFINITNLIQHKYDIQNGKLIKTLIINRGIYPGWLFDIIVTFLEYLSNPNNNLRKIKQCPDCNDFYIQSKLNLRQKYCPNCSNKNHTPSDIQAKRTKVSRDAAKKRKVTEKRKALFSEKCKQLISEGFKKNKAQELAEQYVIEQLRVTE